jgi:hypothetical protein
VKFPLIDANKAKGTQEFFGNEWKNQFNKKVAPNWPTNPAEAKALRGEVVDPAFEDVNGVISGKIPPGGRFPVSPRTETAAMDLADQLREMQQAQEAVGALKPGQIAQNPATSGNVTGSYWPRYTKGGAASSLYQTPEETASILGKSVHQKGRSELGVPFGTMEEMRSEFMDELPEAAREAVTTAERIRLAECGNGDPKQRGPKCRERETEEQAKRDALAGILVNKALTEKATKLDADAVRVRARLAKATPVQNANPLGATLEQMIGATAANLTAWQQAIVAGVFELRAAGYPAIAVQNLAAIAFNAFAAGYGTPDAAVTVTRGCMQLLTRDELQGVIGHEFSHILNGDMRLNLRLMGLINGILCLAIVGRILLNTTSSRRSSNDDRKGGNPLPLFGLALLAIGGIGVFFGRLIQSAVSRQIRALEDMLGSELFVRERGASDYRRFTARDEHTLHESFVAYGRERFWDL